MARNIFLQIRDGKRPLFCPPPMVVIWQLSIMFRLTDWLINILVYRPSFFNKVSSLCWMINSVVPSLNHPASLDKWEKGRWGGRLFNLYWWSLANSTNNPGIWCLKTSVLATLSLSDILLIPSLKLSYATEFIIFPILHMSMHYLPGILNFR